MKAARNKTIDLSVKEGGKYLERCICVNEPVQLGDITNRTILGDTFSVLPLLPHNFADLLIVDPPYNLDKNFNGNRFKKISEEKYREYTEKWILGVLPLLKKLLRFTCAAIGAPVWLYPECLKNIFV